MAIGEGEIVKVEVEVEVEGLVIVKGRGVLLGKLWQPIFKVRYFRYIKTLKVEKKNSQGFCLLLTSVEGVNSDNCQLV